MDISIATFFLKYMNFKDNLIKCKCLYCNKNCQHIFDEKLKEKFFITYKFSNNDNNTFILLLRKGVYPYEYMNQINSMKLKYLKKKILTIS